MTAAWHSAIPPTVPLYWRPRPPCMGRGLLISGLVHDQHRVLVTQMADRPGRCRIEDLLFPDRPR